MTLAPTASGRPRSVRTIDPAADVMNPFARRPRGEQLSRRERAGLLAIFAAVAALIGAALIRAEAPAQPRTPGAAIAAANPNR